MHWKTWPRWLRDTCSVVGAMSLVLIGYDLFFATKVVWWQVPLQILVAFIAVGLWSFYSYRSQAKRRAADQQKALAAQQRAERLAAQQQAAAKQAAATQRRNRQRNQQHQHQQSTEDQRDDS
ncbi:hypothetical protein [Levilactobacillus acidifarinae]|uniref:hypothetical protein n=1 Tax=Levilactobacillus acidifarinae TaxID=267364 RepID=UPI00070F5B3B|nr:hypothetical protein [Levilactobacillus acidifarinae]GEO68872.1 hypothetical protein LAC03_07820 [Levilactobacillus acidifarinae]